MLAGRPEKLDDFEGLLEGYGIVELQRTGRVALPKLDRRPAGDRRAAGESRTIAGYGRLRQGRAPTMATLYYESDADPSLIQGPQGGRPRLRLPGPRPRPQPLRVGGRRPGGAAATARSSRQKAEEAGLRVTSVAEAAAEADVIMILLPDTEQKAVYDAEIAPHLRRRRRPHVRPRLQHPLRPDRPAGRRRRGHGGPQGPGPPGAAHLHRGRRRALAGRRAPGRHRQGPRPRPLLRPRHRGHPGRRARHHLRRGDRDRPVRRAGGALRRPDRAGARPASRRWWTPATSPSRPTSSACTS